MINSLINIIILISINVLKIYKKRILNILLTNLIDLMPPKKGPEHEEKPLWGRPGNTLKMGIVGLPNVGKSSTFNFLAKLNVPA